MVKHPFSQMGAGRIQENFWGRPEELVEFESGLSIDELEAGDLTPLKRAMTRSLASRSPDSHLGLGLMPASKAQCVF